MPEGQALTSRYSIGDSLRCAAKPRWAATSCCYPLWTSRRLEREGAASLGLIRGTLFRWGHGVPALIRVLFVMRGVARNPRSPMPQSALDCLTGFFSLGELSPWTRGGPAAELWTVWHVPWG